MDLAAEVIADLRVEVELPRVAVLRQSRETARLRIGYCQVAVAVRN